MLCSPSVAYVIARDGWSKSDIKQYLYEKVKVQAGYLERLGIQGGISPYSLCALVDEGILPKEYCESSDPNRMVPAFMKADWIGIIVTGDPSRNRNRGYIQNHEQGPPVSKEIVLPANWQQLLTKS